MFNHYFKLLNKHMINYILFNVYYKKFNKIILNDILVRNGF